MVVRADGASCRPLPAATAQPAHARWPGGPPWPVASPGLLKLTLPLLLRRSWPAGPPPPLSPPPLILPLSLSSLHLPLPTSSPLILSLRAMYGDRRPFSLRLLGPGPGTGRQRIPRCHASTRSSPRPTAAGPSTFVPPAAGRLHRPCASACHPSPLACATRIVGPRRGRTQRIRVEHPAARGAHRPPGRLFRVGRSGLGSGTWMW